MVRTFVAVEISEEIRSRVQEAQRLLLQSQARLTLVRPEAVHITLKFLGEIEHGEIEPVVQALSSIRFRSFQISVDGVAGNPPSKPRVVWGIVRDGGECAALARQVEAVLEPLGIEKEGRPYRPHVTLARIRQFDPTLLRQVKMLSTMALGCATISALKLKKSTLTPDGPIYEDIAEVPF
ncbi:MAG: RNA 2',3'-cyclic phosphodiesterase [Methanomicrobiales archaeon]|nr:RNA 2',3'-cyclic phosphodiesterase [Methanomicrobiales archaeon]MDI6875202.1 RNA 2',3'-cyclic phosphodiesterase [Methanomicrobiales archaeon]